MEDERERDKRANDEGDDVEGHKYSLDEADKPSDDDVEGHKFQADKPDESKRKR